MADCQKCGGTRLAPSRNGAVRGTCRCWRVVLKQGAYEGPLQQYVNQEVDVIDSASPKFSGEHFIVRAADGTQFVAVRDMYGRWSPSFSNWSV